MQLPCPRPKQLSVNFCGEFSTEEFVVGRPHHLDSSTTIVPGQERAPASTATLKTVGNSYIGLGSRRGGPHYCLLWCR